MRGVEVGGGKQNVRGYNQNCSRQCNQLFISALTGFSVDRSELYSGGWE